ncbi:dihydroxyacetone kinase subunit DhaL [Lacrimispora sp. BS-2]|uniref:phosphoenolpyruvate--glycerone phosphotransferase n=1 Tax=Lacrimispora sp. BS-2 TaxID=3151850 RepID=A0AAU7PTF4_9FIRM
MVDSSKVIEIIRAIGFSMEEHKEELTELDQPIGDSDHGINLARGFEAVEKKLPELAGKDIGTILKTVGMTLVSTVGGASGPLYGSAYMKAGMALAGKNEMDQKDFLEMMKAAADAVMQRGKAVAEEATMLDAMLPALKAMEEADAAGASAKDMLDAGVRAAWAGTEHTKDLIATKGRASYVGERGLGHQDPGATSFSYMLEVIAR